MIKPIGLEIISLAGSDPRRGYQPHTKISLDMSISTKLIDETQKGGLMFLAIAVETHKHPRNSDDYKVWYVEYSSSKRITNIGVKTKNELIESLFENYRRTGQSNWKCLKKDAEVTTPIEAHDFITKNAFENTHFGNLPTLNEFQKVLDQLEMNLTFKTSA